MSLLNAFKFSCILTILGTIALTIILLSRIRGNKTVKIWTFFCVLTIIWCWGTYIASSATSYQQALWGWRIAYIAVWITPVVFLHFVLTFLEIKKKFLLIVLYSIGIIYEILDFLPSNSKSILLSPKFVFNQIWWLDWKFGKDNILYLIGYVLFYWFTLLYAYFLIIKHFSRSYGLKRNQLKYFILASIIGWLGPEGMFSGVFIDYNFPYPLFNFLILLYLPIFTYAILKYQLLDIRIVLTRLGIFTALYIFLLGVPLYIGHRTQQWTFSAILLAIFASIGPFAYRYLRRKTEDLLFQRSRQYQKILRSASEKFLTYKDKNLLIEELLSLIYNNVEPEFVGIYLLEDKIYSLKKFLPSSILLPSKINLNHPVVEKAKNKESFLWDKLYIATVLPLEKEGEIKGLILLGQKRNKEVYSPEDIEIFTTLLNQASLALENIEHIEEILEEQKEKERLRKEMEMARQIQLSLLPHKSPQIEGFKIEGLMIPALEVAGDYYDFIPLSSQKAAIVVADVSGKGLDSGMVMSMTKSILYTLTKQNLPPKELLIHLNTILCEQLHQRKFISLIYGECTSFKNIFTWAGAGQEHVIMIRNIPNEEESKVEIIKTGGVILGMITDIEEFIKEKSITLEKGDKIILYTDGVIEARNLKGEMFSLRRLKEISQKLGKLPLKDFLLSIKEEIQKFTQGVNPYDDITLVGIEKL